MIYHIAARDDWDRALRDGRYSAVSLKTEGFIHCSTLEQVVQVANVLFEGRTDLVLLFVDADRVDAEIRYENTEGGEDLFPHVYGELEVEAVTEVVRFQADPEGGFSFPV